MNFMSYTPMVPGPGKGFDGIGSPEWLAEMFPGWNQLPESAPSEQAPPDRPAPCTNNAGAQS